jgi:arginase family enzyme
MTKAIRIIGVPMDLGQRRRGVDMGPSAVRYAGLDTPLRALGYDVIDAGNLAVPLPEMCRRTPRERDISTALPRSVATCIRLRRAAMSAARVPSS